MQPRELEKRKRKKRTGKQVESPQPNQLPSHVGLLEKLRIHKEKTNRMTRQSLR